MCDRTVFLNFQSQDTTPFITEVEMLIGGVPRLMYPDGTEQFADDETDSLLIYSPRLTEHELEAFCEANIEHYRTFHEANCTLPEQPTIRNETGSTHSAAKAILQSKKKRLNATSAVEIHAPISSGITWEETVSIVAQSAMIVLVRSDRSFLPKNESGIFLSFSASVMRLTPLST